MPLSNDLISQFVKATNDDRKQETETTIYATAGKTEDGVTYVTFDGAEQPTPVITTTDMQENERVKVTIKDHQAIATGNVSSPGINLNTQINTGINDGTVPVSDIFTATTAYVEELYAQKAYIEELVAEKATIDELIANNITVTDLIAQKATMDKLIANKITVIDLIANEATIDKLIADKATIGDLIAKKADIEYLHANYANIDFANITEAAIEKLYSNIGVIEGFTTKDATVTDKLVAVNIHGDVINAGTLKADKLVVKGTDGLYYRLNVDALGETAVAGKEEYQNGLDGSVIVAQSITANKISATDLVAFNATIGRFNIDLPTDENGEYEDVGSIYSGAKASVDNTTTGIYMDSEGQFAVGDADNYLKFYKDDEGQNKFIVSADEIKFGTGKKTVESYVDETIDNVDLGGRNLLRESNKMPKTIGRDSKCWSYYDTAEYIDNYKGTNFCAVNATDIWSGVAFYLNAFMDEFKVGDTMTFSVNVDNINENHPANIWFYLMQFNGDGVRVYESEILNASVKTLLPGESDRITYTWTLDQESIDVINGGGTSRFTIQLATSDSYNACFYAPKLEKGNKATDWSPAPEDATTEVSAAIEKLRDEIRMSVTDENGESLMVQSGDGWTFNISNIQGAIDSASGAAAEANNKADDVAQEIAGWMPTLESAKENSEYIHVGTYQDLSTNNDEPCIELGEADTENKVIITNTKSLFKIGSDIPTKVSNKGVETDNMEVDNDFIQRNESSSGYYVWKVRSNGNYGLQWRGGNS